MSGIERHLQAAIGYLELGMLVEANDEIENLSPELKTLPQSEVDPIFEPLGSGNKR